MKSFGYHLTVSMLLLSISSALFAQDFGSKLNEAFAFYKANDYANSAKAYTEAFGLQEGNSSQYFNAACAYALSGDTVISIDYLYKAVEKGYLDKNHLMNDPDLNSLHSIKAWNEVLVALQNNIDEYEKNLNLPLKKELEKIYVYDQTLRHLYPTAEEKFGKNSDEMKYFWNLVNTQDSINEKRLVKIIEEHGWPGRSEVGKKANMTVWLVIQHAPLKIQEQYLPLLQASVAEGESSGSNLAYLEDRILMRNNQPQKYGSQIITDPVTGKPVVYEIADPEHVDERRKEVGLSPLKDYLARWNIEWDASMLETPSESD